MIIYSEKDYIGYKDDVVGRQRLINNTPAVVKASTAALTTANKRYLKQLGLKLKHKRKNVKY